MANPRLSQLAKSAILLLFGFAVGVSVTVSSLRTESPSTLQAAIVSLVPTPVGADFGQLVEVWNRVHSDYVNPTIDDRQLLQGALTGLVDGLGDPYSTFLTADSAKKFEDEISGTFEGVGMQVGYKDDRITIIAPLADSPAEKAGLLAGDIILTVDGTDVSTLNIDQVIDKIRGKQGTTVILTIQRGQDPQAKTFAVVRQTISVDSVTATVVERNGKRLADVAISSFNRDTGRELRAKLKTINAVGLDGILIDLRNNPGGYLDQAVDVASVFISNGPVVSEVDRQGENKSFNVNGNAMLPDSPVVILVDGGSASASEIVAGALQDSGRGKIVGTKTFGKGTVQDYQTLRDGSSLKLTIAKWLTPNGRSISEQGITPDLVVEMPIDLKDTSDPQLDRALDLLAPPQ